MNTEIDYKNEIFYGSLQRMSPSVADIQPNLKEYWICSIDPKNTPKLLTLLKSKFEFTSETLRHLKRMQKIKLNDKFVLKVIICPCDSDFETYTHDDLSNLIKTFLNQEDIKLEKKYIPMNKPFDKEINQEWSDKYWPLLWKGNPIIQELNEINRTINIKKIRKYVNILANLSELQDKELPIVTIFVNPATDTIVATRYDERTSVNPIKHTIMDAITEIANAELKRREARKIQDPHSNNYLCLNYHVYTTHEPCAMCSMALVHSRISQLVYLKSSVKTGGIGKNSGHGEMIHISCALNWKFEAFQYIDQNINEKIKDIDPSVYI
jgi:tRNA-specific adenosine deaminase 3